MSFIWLMKLLGVLHNHSIVALRSCNSVAIVNGLYVSHMHLLHAFPITTVGGLFIARAWCLFGLIFVTQACDCAHARLHRISRWLLNGKFCDKLSWLLNMYCMIGPDFVPVAKWCLALGATEAMQPGELLHFFLFYHVWICCPKVVSFIMLELS